MKDGAEVLKQRDFQQGKDLKKLDHDIEDLEQKLNQKLVREHIIRLIKEKLNLDDYYHMSAAYDTVIKTLNRTLKMNNFEIEEKDR